MAARQLYEPDLYLTDVTPRLTLSEARQIHPKFKTLEWSERRLLITEMAFFTKILKKEDQFRVIYICSGGGQHINILAHLFPQLTFICYADKSNKIEAI